MSQPRNPPRHVPTLTEVIDVQTGSSAQPSRSGVWTEGASVPAAAAALDAAASSVPSAVPATPTAALAKFGAPSSAAPLPSAAAEPVSESAALQAETLLPAFLRVPSAGSLTQPSALTQANLLAASSTPVASHAAAAVPELTADAEQFAQRVLTDVQRQIDLMLEYRLREVLGPILARAADTVIKEARQDVATTLKDVIVRAVAQELTRQRLR